MNKVIPERRRSANRYLERVKIIPGDITQQEVDAIVSLLPQSLEYKGSLNSAIAEVAGDGFRDFIENNIFSPRVGDVYAVPGFELPCQHVLFVIRPVWRTEFDREDKVLLNACRRAMEEARVMGLRHIAFPPMGSGVNGFPKKKLARLMLQGIEDRLDTVYENESFEEVRIVARTENSCSLFRERIVQMGV